MTVPDGDVFVRLAWVQAEVDAVAKSRRSGGNHAFSFRGIDDVINVLHPLLAEAGLLISPHTLSSHIEDHTWNKGSEREKVEPMVVADIVFRVFAADGSKLPKALCPRITAFGVDSASDKGPGKANSYGYKTAISTLFSLPTDDPTIDAEMRVESVDVTLAAKNDALRVETFAKMRQLQELDEDAYARVKEWATTEGLMTADGAPMDRYTDRQLARWSHKLAQATDSTTDRVAETTEDS